MECQDYWVYILLCENQSFYTGYTNNLLKRYHSHVNGTGKCKYTRSFKPVSIVQCWLVHKDKVLAMQLEREIKKRSRKDKLTIINHPESLSTNPLVTPYAFSSCV